MVKSWEERYAQLYRPKPKTTPQENPPSPAEDNVLADFNEYIKTLDGKIKFNKRRLFEIYKEHGENALDIYLKEKTSYRPDKPHKTLSVTEAEPEEESRRQKQEEQNTPPDDTQKTPPQEDKDKQENNWIDSYEQSFSGWVEHNTFKQDGKPKRTMTAVKTEDMLDIDLTPVNQSPKRPDQGASYHFENGDTEDKIEVTVTNKNAEKPLNYDYVYALVKSAKENGVDTIEFNDIKTVEFANMLMVASVQFGMKMQNQPEYMIDDSAPYIPPKLKEKIAKYNADKKPLPKRENEQNADDGHDDKESPARPRRKKNFTPRTSSRDMD